jgi:hypothetical protein
MEVQMKAICEGRSTRNDVVHQNLEQYRAVFNRTTQQINVLKDVSVAVETVGDAAANRHNAGHQKICFGSESRLRHFPRGALALVGWGRHQSTSMSDVPQLHNACLDARGVIVPVVSEVAIGCHDRLHTPQKAHQRPTATSDGTDTPPSRGQ